MPDLDDQIEAVNQKLREDGIPRPSIVRRGQKLYLRGTFPPKPGSGKTIPYQQSIALGINASVRGLVYAEREARLVSAALKNNAFDWSKYLSDRYVAVYNDTVGSWVDRFEKDYFTRRQRTPQSEYTFKKDYATPFKRLPQAEELTIKVLKEGIESTEPDSRARKRYCLAYEALAKLAGIEFDAKRYRGNYKAGERTIPTDEEIVAGWEKIPYPQWRNAYGILACYGIRAHELFFLELKRFPILRVTEGKTGARDVYPYPVEWIDLFHLRPEMELPECQGSHADLGHRVATQFRRYELGMKPHDLRHAHALRMIKHGVPEAIAAEMQGHDTVTHTKTYQRWISQEQIDEAWAETSGAKQVSSKS
jgi:integrase